MTHDIIVAALGGTSTCVSGLYLRYIRKRDTAAEELAKKVESNSKCCEHHADEIFLIWFYLRQLAAIPGLPSLPTAPERFDKD